MLLERFDSDFLASYFQVIRERATAAAPLHRAKAMKIAINSKETYNAQFNKTAREDIWQNTKDESWVKLDGMGYIVGLADKAVEFLNQRGL